MEGYDYELNCRGQTVILTLNMSDNFAGEFTSLSSNQMEALIKWKHI